MMTGMTTPTCDPPITLGMFTLLVKRTLYERTGLPPDKVTVTQAAHGGVVEVMVELPDRGMMLNSLSGMGALCQSCMYPGSPYEKMVDGLCEAIDHAGKPYGYVERLEEYLRTGRWKL